MEVNEKEVLRYLGYGQTQAEERILEEIRDCGAQLLQAATPRAVWKHIPLSFPESGVSLGSLHVPGSDLRAHVTGCGEAVLFAATLGAGVDTLLERTARVDMSRAVILQAAAAALTESFCDEKEREISREAAERRLFLRPRYSPGYGDFPITLQRDILRILDCPKRIGLSVTDGCMLVPTKSVTAVIGLTRDRENCHIGKCMDCKSKNCPFRRE